ncbi:Fur family transcriptional regulator [Wenyingzhuangia sp. IMCC45533]
MSYHTQIKELLKDRGLKVTAKRVELLNIVIAQSSAIPRSELQRKLSKIDRVTLYRTLNSLLDSGIIHIAHTSNDDVYYAMCKHHCNSEKHIHKHLHFKCTVCNDVKCVETFEEINIKLPNFSVEDVNIEVTGVCDVCLT